MPEDQNQEQEEEQPSENYCDFTVYIRDSNGNKGMIVEATSMDTEIAFNNILVSDDMKRIMNL